MKCNIKLSIRYFSLKYCAIKIPLDGNTEFLETLDTSNQQQLLTSHNQIHLKNLDTYRHYTCKLEPATFPHTSIGVYAL